MKKATPAKKSAATVYKAKIKSTKSLSELKKNQVLYYYANFDIVDQKFLSELTGLSNESIESISQSNKSRKAPKISFTPKEISIIKYIVKGLTNNEIAKKFNLKSRRGIESSREIIKDKIGVETTAGIILYALKNNIV